MICIRPQFIILASDGLWSWISNQEAVDFLNDHLHEPHFGAKTLALKAYDRGSTDNITVVIIVFKNGEYIIGSSR